jgi:hypothetical protein
MGSFSLSGGVEVFGFISPSNTSDQYPVIDPLYGIDGLRNVNLLSDLDSIPLLRRRAGMIVGVSGGTTYYKLNSPPWNSTISDWSLFNSGGFTGGTVTGDTIFTNGLTATTFSASTYLGLPSDVYVSGYSYSNNTFTIERSFGNPNLTATINDVTGLTVNGDLNVTGTTFSDIISATTYQNLPLDIFVTGGTFSGGVITFINNSGGTFGVSGISSFDTFVTGFTYGDNTFTIFQNSGNSFSVLVDTFTGLTINGDLNVTGTTYTDSISANTYQNLPIDPDTYVTGFSYNNNTFTIGDNSGSTFDATFNDVTGLTINGNLNVTGDTTLNGLTATTISAGTYQNLPLDVFVTGGTYFNGDFTFTNNSGGTFVVSGTTTYSSGLLDGSDTWINNNDGTITFPSLQVAIFGNTGFTEPIRVYTVPSGTTGSGGINPLSNNDTNYIYIDYNNGSPVYQVTTNELIPNGSNYPLYLIVYRANNFVHVLDFGNDGAGLPNKINNRIVAVDRFARESGFSLGLSGSTGVVVLTGGVAWNGTNRQQLVGVNSQDDIFFQNYHSGGTWIYTTTANTLNNEYYDDGTDKVLATAGKYLVNWYFRGQEVNDHLYEVWGNDEYDSVADAQLSVEPLLPELITSHAFLVGRIIVQVSATTGSVESAFVRVFQSTQVTNHNDLLGLQGGIGGEYFHLSATQYNNNAYTNVDNNFSVGQTFNSGLTATTISATTYQNLPIDPDTYITAFTYSSNTLTIFDNSGSTFDTTINDFTGLTINGDLNVTGNTIVDGISANTISATTYFNLPIDPDTYITAFTYSSNTLTIFDNSGSTFNTTINDFTGLTINGDLNVTGNTIVDVLTANTISATTYQNLPIDYRSFGVVVDGAGSVITMGNKGYLSLPYSGYITGWRILGDQSGSTSIDVWKTNYIGFPPTSGDSITGGNYPNLTSQQINEDYSLLGWTTSFTSGDIISFNVLSASTTTRINLTINVIKT